MISLRFFAFIFPLLFGLFVCGNERQSDLPKAAPFTPRNEKTKVRVQTRSIYGYAHKEYGVMHDVYIYMDRHRIYNSNAGRWLDAVDIRMKNGPYLIFDEATREHCRSNVCECIAHGDRKRKVLVRYRKIDDEKIGLLYVSGEADPAIMPRGIYKKFDDASLYR